MAESDTQSRKDSVEELERTVRFLREELAEWKGIANRNSVSHGDQGAADYRKVLLDPELRRQAGEIWHYALEYPHPFRAGRIREPLPEWLIDRIIADHARLAQVMAVLEQARTALRERNLAGRISAISAIDALL